MSLLVSAVAGLAGGATYGAYALIRRYRSRKKLLGLIRRHRAEAVTVGGMRRVTAADADVIAMLGWVQLDEHALRSRGFAVLGDLVSKREAPSTGLSRYFVDESGTMVASLSVLKGSPNACWLALECFTAYSQFMTLRAGKLPELSYPPFVYRQWVGKDIPVDEVIERHRALIKDKNNEEQCLCTIRNLDELVAQTERHSELNREWRNAQPPDALLEADLRSVLGERYDGLGKRFAQRLAAELPEARIRR